MSTNLDLDGFRATFLTGEELGPPLRRIQDEREQGPDPGDTAFLMFFLAIPVVGVCGLVGLGEGVQWGRLRGDHPRQAREHLNHAATLLGIAFTVCIVTGLGLLKLCRVF